MFRIFQKQTFLYILALIFSNWSYSQIASPELQSIIDAEVSVSEKEKRFDLLLQEYEQNNKITLLLNERYEILKWHYKQNHIEKAINLNKLNLLLMDSLNFDDKVIYRKNRYSLGYYLRKNNQEKEASEIFISLIESDTIDIITFKCYSSLAQISYNAEDYYESAKHYENGLRLAKKANNNQYIITFSLGAGYAYKVIKTPKSLKRGITITQNALELLKQHKGNYSVKDKYNLYNLYDLLGNLYNDRDDYNFDLSLKNYNKAKSIALELNDSLRLASVYNNLGYLYLHDMQREAIVYFNKALALKPDVTMLSLLHRNKAEYYLKSDNKTEALKHIQKSISSLTEIDTLNLESLPESNHISELTYKYLLLSSIVDKAKIWIDLSELKPHSGIRSFENALATLSLADELVDIIRLDTNENKSKLFWRETASEIYVNATKVCFELNKPEQAFYFMEKNKAILLLEDLNKKQLLQSSNIPETIVKREALLKTELTSETDKTSFSKAEENYRRFIDSLDNTYRMFYKSQKTGEVISLQTAQNSIEPNKAYVQFILDDDKGYGLIITSKSLDFYKIGNFKTLKHNIQEHSKLLNKPLLSKTDQDLYGRFSYAVYESLFPEDIRGLIQNKSLVIIPDYYLQNIPFEALQTEKKANSFLIFQNEISYSYSISLLLSINKNKGIKHSENKLIGFAPIVFKELSTLKNTKTELKKISSIIPSDLYFESEATTSNFINNIKDYNIIHIASHADAGTNDSINPWIAFYDKHINLQELHQLNHDAELVVLSACETLIGKTFKGEGVMSLTRGFFNSGAKSVVSTLWNINDKSSTVIMEKFYTNLKNGNDKSAALHKAKLEYITSNELSEKSPYYWASFILIGDTDHIIIESNTSIYYYILTSILLIIIALLFLRKNR